MKCLYCEEVFELTRKDKVYCSRTCKVKAKDQRLGRNRHHTGDNVYRMHKGEVCEQCGFVPIHPRQLDVHHINHNHMDNRRNNLRTLCANCHRLEH